MQSKATTSAALLETMMLVRAFKLQNATLAAATQVPGTCTSVGQEAAAAGAVMALGRQDLILANHRSAGHLLARGASPGGVLAEIITCRAPRASRLRCGRRCHALRRSRQRR